MDKISYSLEALRQLQLTELTILQEFDRICRMNSINYVIDAGTLLGAVRHGGFIPWDDDIDVRMLRNDYERFYIACKQQLQPKFFLQTYSTDPGYSWEFSRLLMNDTIYIRENHEEDKAKTGICIDIFPNDTLPNDKPGYWICTALSWLYRKILYSHLGKIHANGYIQRFAFSFLNLFPKRRAHKGLEWLVIHYYNAKSDRVRCFGWGSPEDTKGFNRDWIAESKDIAFEGLLVRAPVKTHEFLVHSFGEAYMTPPPEEQRQPRNKALYITFPE